MLGFALRRMGAAMLVVWLALTLTFVALRWLPGDALDVTLVRAGWGAEEIASRRAALGLDDPVWAQYGRYLEGVVRGDWGESLINGQPVTEIIAQNSGPTATLAFAALNVAVLLGVTLGIVAGASPWRGARYAAEAVASLALATPVYWTATLAITVLTVELHLLPGVGGSGPRFVVLPALVLGFHTGGSIAQVTARSVREVGGEDFVRTARAKGLPPLDVLDHVLRVGLLPVIAVVALQLGFLLGGTVITETIFVRRGLGVVLLNAISNRDFPVVQGVVVLSAVVISTVNALADVLYQLVDPRLWGDDS